MKDIKRSLPIGKVKEKMAGLYSCRFKEYNKLSIHGIVSIDQDCDNLRQYIVKMEEGTAQLLKNQIEGADGEMENDIMTKEDFFSNLNFLDYLGYHSNLKMIYASMLITMYSFLESRLLLACKLIEGRNKIKLKNIGSVI